MAKDLVPGFLSEAGMKCDLAAAAATLGVPLVEVVRRRRSDPAFESACRELEEVAACAMRMRVSAAAATGDLRAARLQLAFDVEAPVSDFVLRDDLASLILRLPNLGPEALARVREVVDLEMVRVEEAEEGDEDFTDVPLDP